MLSQTQSYYRKNVWELRKILNLDSSQKFSACLYHACIINHSYQFSEQLEIWKNLALWPQFPLTNASYWTFSATQRSFPIERAND